MKSIRIVIIILLLALNLLFAYKFYRVKTSPLLGVCPTQAITMVKGKAIIDPAKCIGCGRCVFGIPNPNAKLPDPVQPVPTPATVATEVDSAVVNAAPQKQVIDLSGNQAAIAKPKPKPAVLNFVDRLKCTACGLCIPNCPFQAIRMVNGKAFIDEKKCTGCTICRDGDGQEDGYPGCPFKAITLKRVVKPAADR